jgi:flagellar protein FlbD
MIELTRLNGSSIVLNSDLIKTAESSPDTMLTLITGEKMIVREELDELVNRVLAYRARLLSMVAENLPERDALSSVVSKTGLNFPADQPQQQEGQRDCSGEPLER